ncbi:uncharacterized protein LOC135472626 [Liolophura sinensis]|uniref:uncharacterized protein LOC135472626 n=1 Tax=Liolophura sinensis TaxID=3198878 RepID=UPI00315844FC
MAAENANISTTVADFLTNTTTVSANNTIQITEAPSGDGQGAGAGAIIGAIFGVLLGGVILGGALYLLIRYKRAQAAEYNRSVQVHMSSTRNAGVYVDLAEPSDLPVQNRDYTSLKQQNNTAKKDRLMQSDLYEYDSDDEVAVYN